MASSVRSGEASPSEMIKASFARAADIGAGADALNIFLYSDEKASLAEAEEMRQRLGTAADIGVLAGVPVAIKDNIASLGLPTTCASRILTGYKSPFEATAVKRLRANGALIVAKTNMDEFAMGSSTENSAFGPTRNPHDVRCVPGGSSGGSAAAVAAGITPVALGSETGGSVRQPAAFCGVVGVKPTYGRVSRYGLVAFASSLDQIGVLGRTVDDAALALETIAGFDNLDSTCSDADVPIYRLASLGKPAPNARAPDTEAIRIGRIPVPVPPPPSATTLEGVVIGKPREYFPDSLDASISDLCERALDRFRALGATVREISLPRTSLAIPVYYILAPAEASSNLARFDGVRYGLRVDPGKGLRAMYDATRSQGFGPEVTRRILLGTYVLSAGYYDAYYKKAQAVRTLIADDFRSVFTSGVNAIFTPTTPTPAFPVGAISDPYEMYLNDIFTVTANLAGVPAMSVPIGRVRRLPVGGQIITAHFDEYTMFRVAYALEAALGSEAHQ
ncbi:MAG: Asp-tRNA(Asn)/Glu-tRNA(Gln) amidotransferase subunit GatA [Gemmatimonadetes bacterium]|nr:MAG: Asp-tRNA(Asn)/Glu-tRNA(Gln) amidotransferase subunit GatA [Gemmatimonadota bacterium]